MNTPASELWQIQKMERLTDSQEPSAGVPGEVSLDLAAAAARLRSYPIRSAVLRHLIGELRGLDDAARQRALVKYVARYPDDADALRLCGIHLLQIGRYLEAEDLLRRCVERDPEFALGRFDYARLLEQTHRYDASLTQIERLLRDENANPLFLQLKANILEAVGKSEASLSIWERVVKGNAERPEPWVSYGHALRTVGRTQESVSAYRKALEICPSMGKAYWSLANIKTVQLGDADIRAMQEQLKRCDVSRGGRIALHFALGKALEDAGVFGLSFEHYAKGNAQARIQIDYCSGSTKARVAANKEFFTREFFRARERWGCQAADPIFIVGRPRSGSTLVEQILASHSAVEGASELPYIGDMVRELKRDGKAERYPNMLGAFSRECVQRLGEQYLAQASMHRRLKRAFLTDKKPANFWHIGLINLILPNARIIDVRRHPAACSFSNFKQFFSHRNLRLSELGLYYRDYVELMAHFDMVLPGRIHRVIYENLVADPEAEVKRLLEFLDLPFEDACLRFYETKRSVLTPSSEQVRRPISAESMDRWRQYQPWLKPLIESLGSVLDCYPTVPADLGGRDLDGRCTQPMNPAGTLSRQTVPAL